MMESEMDTKYCYLTIPNYSNNLLMELNKLRINNMCCDTRITTDEGCVLVHKIVMCSASPYFMERLTLTSDCFDVLHLEDTSQLLVNSLIEFIYTGTLHIEKDHVESMMHLLDRIKMNDVETLCEDLKHCGKSACKQIETKITSKQQDEKMSSETSTLETLQKQSRNRKPSKVIRKYKPNPAGTDLGDGGREKMKTNYICTENGNKAMIPRLTISFGKKDKNTWQSEVVHTNNEDVDSPCKKSKLTKVSINKTTDSDCRSIEDGCKMKSAPTKGARITNKKTRKTVKPSVVKRKSVRNKQALDVDKIESKCDVTNDDSKENIDIRNSDSTGINKVDSTDIRNSASTDINKTDSTEPQSEHAIPVDHDEGDVKSSKPNDIQTVTPTKHSRLCRTCDIELPDEKKYLAHMKTHKRNTKVSRGDMKQKYWKCTVCSKQLTSLVRHACHEYSKHGIPYESKLKLHACTFEGCKYITASKHYLQIHMRGRHGNERPHVCEYCGKGFKLPSALVTHLNIHTNKKKYECEECDMTFNQKGGLDIHIKKHHRGQQSWSELCHLCSEKFLHKADLCWHLYNNHGQPVPDRYQIFTCDLCDYKTIRKNKLDRHMDSHEDKRSWVCTLCGKKFVTKSYLNRHVKYHGEKTYICVFDGCNYASVDHVGLKKHVRLMHTHKNYKPFTCTMCSYKTGLRGNLDKHIRTVHNLEVVTKHTVHLKVKFKDMRSGDIITKDGQLVQSASQREVSESNQIVGDCFSDPNDEDIPCHAPGKDSQTYIENGRNSCKKKTTNSVFTPNLTPVPSMTGNDTEAMQRLDSTSLLQTDQHQQQHQSIHYLQNQRLDLANQLQLPFPMATNNRMTLTNQMPGNPSDMFINMDPLFKYQEFYE